MYDRVDEAIETVLLTVASNWHDNDSHVWAYMRATKKQRQARRRARRALRTKRLETQAANLRAEIAHGEQVLRRVALLRNLHAAAQSAVN